MSDGGYEWAHGGVIRSLRDRRRLALVFTGGDSGEGTGEVLQTLAEEGIKGSFFFTGGFLRARSNAAAIKRLIADGHYLGPHSDQHLLYCPWHDREITLVTREDFRDDLRRNIDLIAKLGVRRQQVTWWIPPYEWYNDQIARWSLEMGLRLFNFTPGTLSHTDYTEDDAKNYRGGDTIMQSILDYESREPDGLNGFLLLTHVGAGPRRADKFFRRLPELIGHLKSRGYEFSRVDELLRGAPFRP